MDLNHRQDAYEAPALPSELLSRIKAQKGFEPIQNNFVDRFFNHFKFAVCAFGATNEDRTRNLRLGKATLYRLSHSRIGGIAEDI